MKCETVKQIDIENSLVQKKMKRNKRKSKGHNQASPF